MPNYELHLDSRFEGARKIAACLEGSPCSSPDHEDVKDGELLAVFEDEFVLSGSRGNICHCCYDFLSDTKITLPVKTLKLCSFMAMKHGVRVVATIIDSENPKHGASCPLKTDYPEGKTHVLEIYLMGAGFTLDLEYYKTAGIEGVQVEEV